MGVSDGRFWSPLPFIPSRQGRGNSVLWCLFYCGLINTSSVSLSADTVRGNPHRFSQNPIGNVSILYVLGPWLSHLHLCRDLPRPGPCELNPAPVFQNDSIDNVAAADTPPTPEILAYPIIFFVNHHASASGASHWTPSQQILASSTRRPSRVYKGRSIGRARPDSQASFTTGGISCLLDHFNAAPSRDDVKPHLGRLKSHFDHQEHFAVFL
jgi:hypothetical protein